MDDLRIEWIRDRVYEALDFNQANVFNEFLERDEQAAESQLAQFLNEDPHESKTSLIFYKVIKEEDKEVEVEVGELSFVFLFSFLLPFFFISLLLFHFSSLSLFRFSFFISLFFSFFISLFFSSLFISFFFSSVLSLFLFLYISFLLFFPFYFSFLLFFPSFISLFSSSSLLFPPFSCFLKY